MNKIISQLSFVALALSSTFVSAESTEFYGYARAGLSTTTSGGEQACYGNGASGHYTGRLADECDTYVEIGLKKNVFNKDGATILVDTMLSHQTADGAQRNDYQSIAQPDQSYGLGDTALRQINVQATGLIKSLPDATIWAGKRFYDRKQVALLDLFYLNNSGYGVGLDNIKLGAGDLALAMINGDHDSRTGKINANGRRIVEQNKLDIRYKNIEILGGELDLALIYGWVDLTANQEIAGEDDESGILFTAELTHQIGEGYNTVVFQSGHDSMGAAAWQNASGSSLNPAAWYQGDMKESFRFINYGAFILNSTWDVDYSVIYQTGTAVSASAPNPDATRTSVVISPTYKWTEYSQTRLEFGYDTYQDTDMASELALKKLVLAQEWGALSNSIVRVYAATFMGEQAETRRSGDSEGDNDNMRLGAQLSASW